MLTFVREVMFPHPISDLGSKVQRNLHCYWMRLTGSDLLTFLQSNSRDSDSTLTPVSPTSKRHRTTSKATADRSHRADSKVVNPFLDNGDQEAQGTSSLLCMSCWLLAAVHEP